METLRGAPLHGLKDVNEIIDGQIPHNRVIDLLLRLFSIKRDFEFHCKSAAHQMAPDRGIERAI